MGSRIEEVGIWNQRGGIWNPSLHDQLFVYLIVLLACVLANPQRAGHAVYWNAGGEIWDSGGEIWDSGGEIWDSGGGIWNPGDMIWNPAFCINCCLTS